MSVHFPSTKVSPQLPTQSKGGFAALVRLVFMVLIMLGVPALYVLAAIPYLNAGYDLSKAQLTVTGAPGAYIPFTITIPDTVSSYWSTTGVTAHLDGTPQILTVIPAKEQNWGNNIEGKEDSKSIDGALLLPSTLDISKDLTGTITGTIDYPKASSFIGFHNASQVISVSLHIKLISAQAMFLQSGRARLDIIGILGTLLLGGYFFLLGLYNRVTKIPPLLSTKDMQAGWNVLTYCYMFFLFIYSGISVLIWVNTPAPKNEVFLLSSIMGVAAFLAALMYLLGHQRAGKTQRELS
jgi:hypothetical protein